MDARRLAAEVLSTFSAIFIFCRFHSVRIFKISCSLRKAVRGDRGGIMDSGTGQLQNQAVPAAATAEVSTGAASEVNPQVELKPQQILQNLYEQQNIILGFSIPSQDQGFNMTDLLLLQQLPQLVKQ